MVTPSTVPTDCIVPADSAAYVIATRLSAALAGDQRRAVSAYRALLADHQQTAEHPRAPDAADTQASAPTPLGGVDDAGGVRGAVPATTIRRRAA